MMTAGGVGAGWEFVLAHVSRDVIATNTLSFFDPLCHKTQRDCRCCFARCMNSIKVCFGDVNFFQLAGFMSIVISSSL